MYNCPRCLNNEQATFKTVKGRTYCTKCANFGRLYFDEQMISPPLLISNSVDIDYELNYELTSKQIACAKQVIEYIKKQKDVLIYAACGAGKTEIIMPLITYAFKNSLKIAIAIPRKEVVIEISERMGKAFKKKKVVAIYGGHTDEIDGDLIVCTTHQLYRFYKSFDILIIDEVDAFPFHGNVTLKGIASNCCKGNMVYLSATPDTELSEQIKKQTLMQVTLFERPHRGLLCKPKIKIGYLPYLLLQLHLFINKYKTKTILVFVPSIKIGTYLFKYLSLFYQTVFINSKIQDREVLFKRIKNHEFHIVITTTILERGITIKDVQAVVFMADSEIFDEACLIQISGRIGRHIDYQKGECLLLSKYKAGKLINTQHMISKMNNNG